MFSGLRRRALASLLVTVLAAMALVSPAAAFTPPVDGGGWCDFQDAGWDLGYTGTAAWNGTLQWQLCLNEVSGGQVIAKTQLSAPVTTDQYNRFTGQVLVKLQICNVVGGYTTIAGPAEYDYLTPSTYDNGQAAGGNYYFDIWKTSSTAQRGGAYRVMVKVWNGAVVAHKSIFSILLAPSATGEADFYSDCRAL